MNPFPPNPETPRTDDGKPIFLLARFRGDVDPCFVGAGDTEAERGGGPLLHIGWPSLPLSPDDKGLEWSFSDWLYVAKGSIVYLNGGPGDHMSFKCFAPATPAPESTPGTGNCNLLALGGGLHRIDWAPGGDGSHTVDFAAAVPIPANPDNSGLWEWTEPDTGRGEIFGQADGRFHLYDFPIDLVRWVIKLPLLGSGSLTLQPETKSRKVLPHWIFRVDVHNESLGALQASWFMDCARKKTT